MKNKGKVLQLADIHMYSRNKSGLPVYSENVTCGCSMFISRHRNIGLIWECIQTFSDEVDNEINNSNNKRSIRSNIKCYGHKIH
jgi:hypothetical protein